MILDDIFFIFKIIKTLIILAPKCIYDVAQVLRGNRYKTGLGKMKY